MKISVKNSQTYTRFVDDYIKSKGLSIVPELRKEAITALKIAGVDLKSRKALGTAVIEKTFSVQDPQNLVSDKDFQPITAVFVECGWIWLTMKKRIKNEGIEL